MKLSREKNLNIYIKEIPNTPETTESVKEKIKCPDKCFVRK